MRVEIDGGTPTAKLELKQGRVDLAMGSSGSIAYSNVAEGGIYATLPRSLGTSEFGMAFPNEKMELGLSLQKALNELIDDGTYARILKKWNLPVEDMSIGKATINGAPDPVKCPDLRRCPNEGIAMNEGFHEAWGCRGQSGRGGGRRMNGSNITIGWSGTTELRVTPLTTSFAAEVEGVDLRQPIDERMTARLRKALSGSLRLGIL